MDVVPQVVDYIKLKRVHFAFPEILRGNGRRRTSDCRQTEESWNQQLEKGKESDKLIVVDFTASWCGPCKLIAPAVEELAWKLPNVTFLKVDVDELQSVAQEWDVRAMPTFIFLKDGKIVEKYTGANKMKLQAAVEKHAIETA